MATLESMATYIDADTILLREQDVENGKIEEYLIRSKVIEEDFQEVRYLHP